MPKRAETLQRNPFDLHFTLGLSILAVCDPVRRIPLMQALR